MTHWHLVSANGRHRATVSSFGARLLQWSVDGRELLFTPALLATDEQLASHGGVPVLFPQFGLFGPGRKHGIVRDVQWQPEPRADDSVLMRLRTAADGTEYELVLRVDLSDEGPRIYFSASNLSNEAVAVTCGLHTYLRVPDIASTQLHGLEQTAFEDALDGLSRKPASGEALAAPINVDRVYVDAPAALTLRTADYDLRIEQTGFADTVVWNPGANLAAQLADLQDGEWRQFLCVEAAQIRPPLTLGAWDTWYGSQSLRLL